MMDMTQSADNENEQIKLNITKSGTMKDTLCAKRGRIMIEVVGNSRNWNN